MIQNKGIKMGRKRKTLSESIIPRLHREVFLDCGDNADTELDCVVLIKRRSAKRVYPVSGAVYA